ncbi:hypothetical protein FOMA001_g2298 [Fusarium oxysporum f. sp. matthiolae]|nr:hypothetical protein FOMA001_g19885 [Fusarium oxysporum f. sp. matthiolae]KAH7490835.1 hypothetical protein FOMA001_g2298 [Fusarium oxysporum f. sp. matthiolae]
MKYARVPMCLHPHQTGSLPFGEFEVESAARAFPTMSDHLLSKIPIAAIHSAPYHEALRRESGVLSGVPHLSGMLQTQGKHLDRQIDHGDDARRDAERVCD